MACAHSIRLAMIRTAFTIALFFSLVFSSAALAQQPTAYQALRSLAGQRDQSFLNRVVKITGSEGTTQPLVWKILIDDPTARSGVREFEVSNGRILSERAPLRLRGHTGSHFVIALRSLNLDSDGAFVVANQEAKRQFVGFDSADYALQADDSSGSPIWSVVLKDYTGTPVGTVLVSGSTGNLVRAEGMRRRNPADATVWPGNEPGTGENVLQRTGRHLNRAGEATRRGTLRVIGNVQEFITGRRTVGEE